MNNSLPKVVYKYRDWENEFHRKLLVNNQLYLASPKDINDPLDCRIPPDFRVLDTVKKKEDFVDKLLIKHFYSFQKEKEDISKLMQRADYNFQQNFDKHIHWLINLIFEKQNKHYGILSMSRRWDSTLMWSHYANQHRGFCVGLDPDMLRESGLIGTGGDIFIQKTISFLL